MTRAPPAALAVLLLALLAAPLGAPPAQAAGSGVHSVVLDQVEDIDPARFRFEPCADTAAFVPVDGGFRFEERQSSTGGGTPYPGGYLAIGCGRAELDLAAPPGAAFVEVRFLGDRVVDEFNVQGAAVSRPGRSFTQEVRFETPNATADRRVAYADPAAPSQPLAPVTVDAFQLPRAGAAFTLAWDFQDASYFVAPNSGLPDVLSGQAFAATVKGVQLRYLGLPVDSHVADELERQGSLLVGRTRVRIDVADPMAGDLRVEVAAGLSYSHLIAADGKRLEAQASRTDAGPDGFDRSAVLVETLPGGAQQVTVPRELLAEHGAGRYTLAFTSVDAIETFPWLLPLAFLAMLAPIPVALLAYRHVRRFEVEAFGGFRRSARNLRLALVVAVAYYGAVLLSHFLGSRIELMAAWPLPVEAILLYVQVAVAVAAFLALHAVARELYQITVPKALPPGRAGALPIEDAE